MSEDSPEEEFTPSDADEDHPSTLCLVCDTDGPPSPFEVFQRLENAGLSCKVLNEETREGDAWGRMVQIGEREMPWSIWCMRRDDDFQPWDWSPARWRDEQELEQTKKARWLLFLQTVFEPNPEPNKPYLEQLKLLHVMGEGLATGVLDMNAMSIRSFTSLRELAECEVAPAPEELYQVHVVAGDGLHWLHTHGLRRFHLPDFEIIGVPAENLVDAFTAFQWLVAYMLPEKIPCDGELFWIGNDIQVGLTPWEWWCEENADGLGCESDRDSDDHRGWRLVVVDPLDDDDPDEYHIHRFLEAVKGDPVFWLSDSESRRREQLARARFGLAAAAWYSRQFTEKRMGVKIGVPYSEDRKDLTEWLKRGEKPEGGNREHMWFELKKIEGDRLTAVLENQPVYATYLKTGEEYQMPISSLSEFNIVLDGEFYSPATITELDIVTHRTGNG